MEILILNVKEEVSSSLEPLQRLVLWTGIWLVEGRGARRFDRTVGHGKNRKKGGGGFKGQVLGEKEGRCEGSWASALDVEETSS